MMNTLNMLQSERGNEAVRKDAGAPAAELQNSDVTKIMEDMVRDLKRRVEDLEDAGTNIHPIAFLPQNAKTSEIITRINYMINILNEGTSNGSIGYI